MTRFLVSAALFCGTAAVGLLVADLVLSGMSTWFFATLTVWPATLFAAWLLPRVFLNKGAEERRS